MVVSPRRTSPAPQRPRTESSHSNNNNQNNRTIAGSLTSGSQALRPALSPDRVNEIRRSSERSRGVMAVKRSRSMSQAKDQPSLLVSPKPSKSPSQRAASGPRSNSKERTPAAPTPSSSASALVCVAVVKEIRNPVPLSVAPAPSDRNIFFEPKA